MSRGRVIGEGTGGGGGGGKGGEAVARTVTNRFLPSSAEIPYRFPSLSRSGPDSVHRLIRFAPLGPCNFCTRGVWSTLSRRRLKSAAATTLLPPASPSSNPFRIPSGRRWRVHRSPMLRVPLLTKQRCWLNGRLYRFIGPVQSHHWAASAYFIRAAIWFASSRKLSRENV